MTFLQSFLQEMEKEAITTRKMLERVPDGKYDWKPHEKSMTMGRLVTHIAELPSWVNMVLTTSELDFAANDYKPTAILNNRELLACLEKNLADAKTHFINSSEDQLDLPWTLRNGEQIYSTDPKRDVIRMVFCQIVHHRAQLGVYLRLQDIPIPGSYGPSADEPNF